MLDKKKVLARIDKEIKINLAISKIPNSDHHEHYLRGMRSFLRLSKRLIASGEFDPEPDALCTCDGCGNKFDFSLSVGEDCDLCPNCVREILQEEGKK